MKAGDLIRVQYPNDRQWWHGIVFKAPDDPSGIWRMWCIEHAAEHVLSPVRDTIEVLNTT